MREQTLPRPKGQTGLPGMLQRTKYSRLRSDSLSSSEDRPRGALPLKADLCLDHSSAQQVTSRTGSDQGASTTLRGFIPRMANIRLHSPASLLGLRGQTNRQGTDEPSPGTDWSSQTSLPPAPLAPLPLLRRQARPTVLQRTKRPITLHCMASLPWTPGCPLRLHGGDCLPGLKTSPCRAKESAASVPESRVHVHRHIKYMGSVEVTRSMRALDFDTRMQVTREAISRLCERTSEQAKITARKKKPVDNESSAVLGQSNLQFSGRRVNLSVSADSVVLTTSCLLQTIAHHPMQSISFASGGEPDMADYIAYVAKDPVNQRACHILECPHGRATEVINSIGQAFETRFHQLLCHGPSVLTTIPRSALEISDWSPGKPIKRCSDQQDSKHRKHHDYYNDIPGKLPPPGGIRDMRISSGATEQDGLTICSFEPVSLYENCSIADDTLAPPVETGLSDMVSVEQCATQLKEEGWFHGRLSRAQAELLLCCSGDFLVRESSHASGQYVLSGMEGASVRHLLLVDPHGQVRTRDQVFLSVGHLVRFHMESQVPIVSGTSELCLRQPVLQTH